MGASVEKNMTTTLTIVRVLEHFQFDKSSGKVYRMYKGPDDGEDLKEYELPLTDSYLNTSFNPKEEFYDFFAEDAEHFYFPVPNLPGEKVGVCKTKKATRQLFPLQTIRAQHGDEMIHLNFSKQLVLDVGDVVGEGKIAVYWREARVAAVGDSVDSAMIRAGINIVNRLVSAQQTGEVPYAVKPDFLLTKLLHQKGINVAVHCTEVPPEQNPLPVVNNNDLTPLLEDPCTSHTMQDLYNPDKDPNLN